MRFVTSRFSYLFSRGVRFLILLVPLRTLSSIMVLYQEEEKEATGLLIPLTASLLPQSLLHPSLHSFLPLGCLHGVKLRYTNGH